MRPGIMLSAGCLALLAVWRLNDGRTIAALVLLATAVTVVAVGLGLSRRASPQGSASTPALSASERAAAREEELRVARGWRRIALLGLVISVAGAFVFPPMSLVVAALALYSLHRRRRSLAEAAALASAPERKGERQGC